MFSRSCLMVCLFAFLLAFGVNAQTLTWTLSGVTFDDGGTGSGSFNYDASTNTYSNVNITTTSGSKQPGASYSVVITQISAPEFLVVVTTTAANLLGTPGLSLQFAPVLGDFGGTSTLPGQFEGICGQPNCFGIVSATLRNVTGGTVGSSETLEQYMFFGG
jgi:hypothetical protein